MNIRDLKIYKNNLGDASKLETGEIYVLLYNDNNIYSTKIENFDTEIILKIQKVDLIYRNVHFNVILSRYIIPEDSSDEEIKQIILNWEVYNKEWWEYKSLPGNGTWSINGDGAIFIKFDEYQEYLNNKTNKTICPHHEEKEING